MLRINRSVVRLLLTEYLRCVRKVTVCGRIHTGRGPLVSGNDPDSLAKANLADLPHIPRLMKYQ